MKKEIFLHPKIFINFHSTFQTPSCAFLSPPQKTFHPSAVRCALTFFPLTMRPFLIAAFSLSLLSTTPFFHPPLPPLPDTLSLTPTLSLPSLSHPLFFVHLPKCAGSSVRKSLFQFAQKYLRGSEICIPCEGKDRCRVFSMSKCISRQPVLVGGHFNFEETKEMLRKSSAPNSVSSSPPLSPAPYFNLSCVTFIRDPISRMISMYYFITSMATRISKKKTPSLSSLSPRESSAAIDIAGDFALKANYGPHKAPLLQQFGSMSFPYNESALCYFERRMRGNGTAELVREGWGEKFLELVNILLREMEKKERAGEGAEDENREKQVTKYQFEESPSKEGSSQIDTLRTNYSPKENRAILKAHTHLRQCVILRVEEPQTSNLISKAFLPAISSAIRHASKITLNKATSDDAHIPLPAEVQAYLLRKYSAEMELYDFAISLHRLQSDAAQLIRPHIESAVDTYPF